MSYGQLARLPVALQVLALLLAAGSYSSAEDTGKSTLTPPTTKLLPPHPPLVNSEACRGRWWGAISPCGHGLRQRLDNINAPIAHITGVRLKVEQNQLVVVCWRFGSRVIELQGA